MTAKTLSILLSILLFLTIPSIAVGFGKNKVQYQYMNWSYYKAAHYTLYFHQDQGELPETAYRWLDDIYDDLRLRFGFAHQKPVPVVLYESPALFEQTNIITEILPEEVGGFTELFKNRIAIPFNGSPTDLRHVLHHEMVHAFIFGAIYEGSIFKAAGAQIPLWFNEGLAELLSSGWNRESDAYMLDMLLHSNVPPPGYMLNGYLAYKGGQSFLYYLYSTSTDSLFNSMLKDIRKSKSAEKSIEFVYKKTLEELGREWISELRRLYWPEIGRRMAPSDHAAPVTTSAKDKSHINLRPRISPDGKSIAFFSDRHDYTKIIITDVKGKGRRQIRQHTLSGSFESFQHASGALTWSPSGSELAFIAKKDGRNDIRIVSAKTGKLTRRIWLPLSAINGLDWSRDGKSLALTAILFGETDLYVYDLESQSLTLVGGDIRGAKGDPRFSPDGKKIVFTVTDTIGLSHRPLVSQTLLSTETTDLPRQNSSSNLAIVDVDKDSSYLLTNTTWNDKQAAFSPDGRSVVFVSDRNGIDNLYVLAIDAPNSLKPLTDYTGNAGNPDWATDAIVYDNFLSQAWNIWYMDKPLEKILGDSTLVLTRWAEHEESGWKAPFFQKRESYKTAEDTANTKIDKFGGKKRDDGVQSRRNRSFDGSDFAGDIDNKTGGNNVSDADSGSSYSLLTPDSYKLQFTPDLVIFGLGVSTYSGASGQALAMFSDYMGDHRITAAGDLQFDLSEYAQIYAAYEYLKLRVNTMIGGFYNKYYSYDGLFNRYYHDLETGGFVGLSYPFSIFSRVDMQIIARYMRREPILGGDTATTLESNAAIAILGYSFDNILWGITGPLNGVRGRAQLHIAPPLSLTSEAYLSGDIDIRHYTHILKKYVWANRVTLGATVGLGDDKRAARRFFLGGDNNWFNYDVNYENYEENLAYSYYSDIISPLRGWDYFDITGDKMFLMNSEFRFPFIREVSTVWPIPLQIRYINGALFIDAGYAWEQDEQKTKFFPIPPKIVGGYGFGVRANLGIFVLRYDRGWPTDWKNTGVPINYFSLGAEF